MPGSEQLGGGGGSGTPGRQFVDGFIGSKPRLAIRTWAGAGPAFVLVHGLTLNLATWPTLVASLPADSHVVALDLRSHGQSDGDVPQEYVDYAADVVAAAVATGQPRPMVIGHSWGARVALYAAAEHPDTFRGVVALDQALWDYAPTAEYLSRDPSDAGPPDRAITDDEFAEILAEATIASPIWAAIVERQYHRTDAGWMVAPSPKDGYELMFAEARGQPLERHYARITCPVMLVFARDEEDFGFAPAVGRQANVAHLARTHQTLRIEWIDGDHGFPIDRPDEVADLAADFDRHCHTSGSAAPCDAIDS